MYRLTASTQQLLKQGRRMGSRFVSVFFSTTCAVHEAPKTLGRCCCRCWKNFRRQSRLRCFILRSFAASSDACCRSDTTKHLEWTTSKLMCLMTQLSLVGKVSPIYYSLLNEWTAWIEAAVWNIYLENCIWPVKEYHMQDLDSTFICIWQLDRLQFLLMKGPEN